MKGGEIISSKNEIFFVLKLIGITISGLGISMVILLFFLNRDVGDTYLNAFQTTSDVFNMLHYFILLAIIVQLVISLLLTYFVSIHFSHKIAGPMYRLKKTLKDHMEGVRIKKLLFRKTDFLPGVRDSFSQFFAFLDKRERLLNEAESLVRKLEQKHGETRVKNRLEDIIKELESYCAD